MPGHKDAISLQAQLFPQDAAVVVGMDFSLLFQFVSRLIFIDVFQRIYQYFSMRMLTELYIKKNGIIILRASINISMEPWGFHSSSKKCLNTYLNIVRGIIERFCLLSS